ncbi:MAG: hypothetical protein WC682_04230 [Parcubacteria group bacterium]|jgi:hypothetical protein
MSKKWKLNIGCHCKTLMSRDLDVREHDSLEDCKRDVKESEEFWARMGYCVWFAKAIGPDGEKVELHKDTPFY